MAFGRRKLIVEVVGDSRSLERTFKRVEGSSRGFGSRVAGSLAAIGTAAGAALGVGLVVAAKRGIDELKESQKVAAQTAAAIKSTGAAAKVTAKEVSGLATALSEMSGVDDEVIQGAENLLLTFTKVQNQAGKGNDIFTQATKTILDMSVALGEDANSAAIQLGKALNDPIRGVTALRRVGVSFTEAQQKQIKALVAANRTLDAQKLILKELRTEFGGSAKAAGDTLSGSINKLTNSFDELLGTLAAQLAPQIKAYIDQAVKWLRSTENQKRVLDDFKEAMRIAGQALQIFIGIVRRAVAVFHRFSDAVGGTRHALIILASAIAAVKIGGMLLKINALIGAAGTATTGGTGVMGLSAAFRIALPFAVAAGVGLAIKKLTPLDEKIADLQKRFPAIFELDQPDPSRLSPKLQQALKNRPGDARRRREAEERRIRAAGVRQGADERALHRSTQRAIRAAEERNRQARRQARAARAAASVPSTTAAAAAGRTTVVQTPGMRIRANKVTVTSKQPVQLNADVNVSMDGRSLTDNVVANLNRKTAVQGTQRRGRHGGISVVSM